MGGIRGDEEALRLLPGGERRDQEGGVCQGLTAGPASTAVRMCCRSHSQPVALSISPYLSCPQVPCRHFSSQLRDCWECRT
jgi:hypothetical protein